MKQLLLLILSVCFIQNLQAQSWGQTQKLVASDRVASNEFGTSVAIDGNYMVVGSPFDALGSVAKGSVYIFKNDGSGNWVEHQKLLHPGSNAFDFLGSDVDINGDYIIVGSRGQDFDSNNANFLDSAGAAYIFERDGTDTWNFVSKLVAPDRASADVFSESVAIDGNYAVVVAPQDDEDVNGNNTIPESGSAYIFERDGSGNWNFVQKVTASERRENDRFGKDGSISIEGDYIFIGASQEDEDENDENTISGTGSVYVFKRDNMNVWSQTQKLVASDREAGDNFGWAINAAGNYLVVGAAFEDINNGDNAGAAYIFERSGDLYTQTQKLVASNRNANDAFGYTVDISDDTVIVGAYNKSVNNSSFAGACYIFEKSSSDVWEQVQYNYALDFAASDRFGYDVGISGDFAIAGAYQEDEDELGENTLSQAGSVYVFEASAENTLNIQENVVLDLNLYPNPVNDILNIDLAQNFNSVSVSVTNALGQKVFSEKFHNVSSLEVPFYFSRGLYLITVAIAEGQTSTFKVLKY